MRVYRDCPAFRDPPEQRQVLLESPPGSAVPTTMGALLGEMHRLPADAGPVAVTARGFPSGASASGCADLKVCRRRMQTSACRGECSTCRRVWVLCRTLPQLSVR